MPPLESASVSMTPGPPAWVTMAKRFSSGVDSDGRQEKMQPTVVSSSREKQRTMPALRKRASTAESLVAMAPVCEEAALLPLSLAPLFMAAMRHPFRMSELAWKRSLSGFDMFSIYSSLIAESRLGSKRSSIY